VVIRGWDLKFVDELPKKAPKPISEKKYLKAKKIIERYEKEIIH
jgi:peptide subunit release factor 1 (eRF1)